MPAVNPSWTNNYVQKQFQSHKNEILSCQKHTLVGLVNLLTQYGNADCFPDLPLATMFGLMHICKCTISVSSHQITDSSMALCLCTWVSLMSFIILWALPYWKIRQHVNLVGWPVIYNIHYCACDEAFNFYIVCRASVCRFNTSLECYHTIVYVFARIIIISKHTTQALFPPQRDGNFIECCSG